MSSPCDFVSMQLNSLLHDLAQRAVVQAVKFGTRMANPVEAVRLERHRDAILRLARLEGMVLEDRPMTDFSIPDGMTQIQIDRKTGMRASEGGDIIVEAFKPGTGPADSYFVIGADQVAIQAQQAERQRQISPNAQQAVQSGSGGLF